MMIRTVCLFSFISFVVVLTLCFGCDTQPKLTNEQTEWTLNHRNVDTDEPNFPLEVTEDGYKMIRAFRQEAKKDSTLWIPTTYTVEWGWKFTFKNKSHNRLLLSVSYTLRDKDDFELDADQGSEYALPGRTETIRSTSFMDYDTAKRVSNSIWTISYKEEPLPTQVGQEVVETQGGNPIVIMSTSKEDIKIELYPDKASETVNNFLAYVNDKFYDGTIFHRVIPGFMIQGGGFAPEMQEKTTKPPIKNEADNGLKNDTGTIAMARTSVVDSATSQFFINLTDNDFLNHGNRDFGYAVFGKVVEGMDVVNKIAGVKTGNHGMHRDVPLEPVVVESIRVIEPVGK